MHSIKIPQIHMHFEIDKNFIPEILRQLDIVHDNLKFATKFLKISK